MTPAIASGVSFGYARRMKPDDRPFTLKWSRTWPQVDKHFTGKDPRRPDMFARVYLSAPPPHSAKPWSWTLADRRQIALGYAPTTRAARTAVEKAYREWRAKQ
jgi:hypothetical protein